MTENAAVLIRVLKGAHASRFKKYQEKLEGEKRQEMIDDKQLNHYSLIMAISV